MRLMLIALLLCGTLKAQDTVILNGANKVTFNLNRAVTSYFIGCTQYAPATTIVRNVAGVGKVLIKPNGQGYIIPLARYRGTWTYYYPNCSLLSRSIVFLPSAPTPTPATPNSFTLAVQSRTSAVVYQSGVLIRTLWSNEVKAAGTHTITWNRKKDNGDTVTGAVQVKVISHQMSYQWTANIGNTSRVDTGSHKLRGLRTPFNGVEVGNYIYFAKGNTEGNPPVFKVAKNDINYMTEIYYHEGRHVDFQTEFIASDGVRVYYAGYDAWNGYWPVENTTPPDTNSKVDAVIYATQVSNDAAVTFSSGSTVKPSLSPYYTYSGVGVILSDATARPTGLAVQRYGSHLFCAHGGKNQIRVYNKTTGAFVRTVTATVGAIAVDSSWLYGTTSTGYIKYLIGGAGELTPVDTVAIGGKALNIAALNGKIMVVDDSFSVVKSYNRAGELQHTLGTSGGYVNSPAVTNTKFNFVEFKLWLRKGFVVIQNDGSYWVGDAGNCRTIRFNSSNVYVDHFAYLPTNYNCAAIKDAPNRVFAGYLEFDGSTGGLTYNWSGNVTALYKFNDARNIFYNTFQSAGRTYALVYKYPNLPDVQTRYPVVVELTNTGLRYTGVELSEWVNYKIEPSGNLLYYSGNNEGTSGSAYIKLKQFTGLSSGNPTWGSETNLHTIPLTGQNAFYKCDNSGVNSKGVIFSQSKDNAYYHLGRVQAGAFVWQACPSTATNYAGNIPTNGTFDRGNGVNNAGWSLYDADSLFVWSYIGEFWKNSQTNIWNLYHQDGLMLMQIGKTVPDAKVYSDTDDAPREAAGNMLGAQMVKNGNYYDIYYCDESHHGAIHRFRISGAGTIQIHNISM